MFFSLILIQERGLSVYEHFLLHMDFLFFVQQLDQNSPTNRIPGVVLTNDNCRALVVGVLGLFVWESRTGRGGGGVPS